MQTYETRKALRQALKPSRLSGKCIGLVPTMGNLHDGHIALVKQARQHCDLVITSIFVNPLQFGPGEDLDNYPRTLNADIELLTQAGCDGVFIPAVAEMYPNGLAGQTLIIVPGLSERHCGASRPGHFNGVCTVVCKLFNLVQPDIAWFGEKDFQQLQIIRKMTSDLCLPILITGVATIRADSGLALSSRNQYLNAEDLARAPALFQQLQHCAGEIRDGNNNFQALEQAAVRKLEKQGLKTDYFHICQAASLEPAQAGHTDIIILAAAWLGTTRLIDNIIVTRDI